MASRLRDFTRIYSPVYTGSKIAENIVEECSASMLHENMELSRLMVCIQQVEEKKKRNHTSVGNNIKEAEKNFLGKNSIEIRDMLMFKKGLSHQVG